MNREPLTQCLVTCDPVYSPGVRKDVKDWGVD